MRTARLDQQQSRSHYNNNNYRMDHYHSQHSQDYHQRTSNLIANRHNNEMPYERRYCHKQPQILIGDSPMMYERNWNIAVTTAALAPSSTLVSNTYHHGKNGTLNGGPRVRAQDTRCFTERRIKKTVRFDSHEANNLGVEATTTTTFLSNQTSLPPVTSIMPATAVEVGAATLLTSTKLGANSNNNANTARTNTSNHLIDRDLMMSQWSTQWDDKRQSSQDSATKDSGIDTSSNFTSSEESNRGDILKVDPCLDFLSGLTKNKNS